MDEIIDGKAIAAAVRQDAAAEVRALVEKGIQPGLAVVIVGDDPASRIYVNNKKKACQEIGVYSEEYALPATTTQEELLQLIENLNKKKDINGILVQSPLPQGLDEKAVYNVTVQNGQAIIANDNATVTATANIGLNTNELKTLIEAVRVSANGLNAENKETVSDSLEVIEVEATAEKPKKGMLKTAITALTNVKDTVKGVAEFGTAVTALIQLIAPLIQ